MGLAPRKVIHCKTLIVFDICVCIYNLYFSNKQVLDLVHPSLYCYVQGITKECYEEATSAVDFDCFIGGGNRY